MGSDTFYNKRRFLWGVVRFVWAVTCVRRTPRRRRGMGAGSACPRPVGAKCTRVQPARARRTGEARKSMRVQPAGLSLRRGILKEEGKNPLLAAKKVGGAAGGALYWILITR